MMSVRVRVHVSDTSRIGEKLGLKDSYSFYIHGPDWYTLTFSVPSEEEAVRVVALAVLAGYVAWTEPEPP